MGRIAKNAATKIRGKAFAHSKRGVTIKTN